MKKKTTKILCVLFLICCTVCLSVAGAFMAFGQTQAEQGYDVLHLSDKQADYFYGMSDGVEKADVSYWNQPEKEPKWKIAPDKYLEISVAPSFEDKNVELRLFGANLTNIQIKEETGEYQNVPYVGQKPMAGTYIYDLSGILAGFQSNHFILKIIGVNSGEAAYSYISDIAITSKDIKIQDNSIDLSYGAEGMLRFAHSFGSTKPDHTGYNLCYYNDNGTILTKLYNGSFQVFYFDFASNVMEITLHLQRRGYSGEMWVTYENPAEDPSSLNLEGGIKLADIDDRHEFFDVSFLEKGLIGSGKNAFYLVVHANMDDSLLIRDFTLTAQYESEQQEGIVLGTGDTYQKTGNDSLDDATESKGVTKTENSFGEIVFASAGDYVDYTFTVPSEIEDIKLSLAGKCLDVKVKGATGLFSEPLKNIGHNGNTMSASDWVKFAVFDLTEEVGNNGWFTVRLQATQANALLYSLHIEADSFISKERLDLTGLSLDNVSHVYSSTVYSKIYVSPDDQMVELRGDDAVGGPGSQHLIYRFRFEKAVEKIGLNLQLMKNLDAEYSYDMAEWFGLSSEKTLSEGQHQIDITDKIKENSFIYIRFSKVDITDQDASNGGAYIRSFVMDITYEKDAETDPIGEAEVADITELYRDTKDLQVWSERVGTVESKIDNSNGCKDNEMFATFIGADSYVIYTFDMNDAVNNALLNITGSNLNGRVYYNVGYGFTSFTEVFDGLPHGVYTFKLNEENALSRPDKKFEVKIIGGGDNSVVHSFCLQQEQKVIKESYYVVKCFKESEGRHLIEEKGATRYWDNGVSPTIFLQRKDSYALYEFVYQAGMTKLELNLQHIYGIKVEIGTQDGEFVELARKNIDDRTGVYDLFSALYPQKNDATQENTHFYLRISPTESAVENNNGAFIVKLNFSSAFESDLSYDEEDFGYGDADLSVPELPELPIAPEYPEAEIVERETESASENTGCKGMISAEFSIIFGFFLIAGAILIMRKKYQ